jgi:hypothetical protein
MSDKIEVDKIGDIPVYYDCGKFTADKDGLHFEATTKGSLEAQLKGLDKKPTKVIFFNLSVYGGYSKTLEVWQVIQHSPRMIYRISEDGKKGHISADHLYVWTPELEEKLKELFKRAQDLRNDIEKALGTAKYLH